jgi:polyphosphate kinase 2 (PPK2 family)
MDKRLRFMTDLIAPLKVPPGNEVRLSRDHDPGYTGEVARPQAAALLADGVELLADYQDRLAAQDTFGVLLVLQGLDASGKDSTIKHVMSGVNPQAVEVRAFKQPSAEELNHDFLWRYQPCPGGAGSASSTGPTTRRCSSSGSTRSAGRAADARGGGRPRDLGPPLP